MPPRVVAVVMAGGKGERFWPASTANRPKQFVPLCGNETLIQQTVRRMRRIVNYSDIYVVTSMDHLALACEQLPCVPGNNFIVEPVGRDTAPCVGLAAVWLERVNPDTVALVVPSDHLIPDEDRFCELAQLAIDHAASSSGLVTLGIQPTRPETGYGYIELGMQHSITETGAIFSVNRFVEKPSSQVADQYLRSGRFLWNAGMFAWRVASIREEISCYIPELHGILERLRSAPDDAEFQRRLLDLFPQAPRISVDYGIMERSQRVFVIPSNFRWDDLGNWNAIARMSTADEQGNVLDGPVLAEDSHNLFVKSQGRLVATLGIHDVVVVETDEVVLICARDRVQDIRLLAVRAQEVLSSARLKG